MATLIVMGKHPTRSAKTPRDVAVRIVRTLRDSGYVAYLAGGCVRDELLGYHPKDYDVATDAHPDKVGSLFPGSRFIGEAFGVVQVRVKGMAKHPVEVATFRSEWGYEDGRRPTSVHFTDAEHDALRRDFTINGLFEDPLAVDDGTRVIDYVGGRADLEAGVVRAIGDPDERFAEDYLRMLRAVRFASRLGFTIDPETAGAIREHAVGLGRISRERIGQELMWMLTPGLPPEETGRTRGGVDARSAQAVGLIQDLQLDAPTLDEDHYAAKLATVDRLVEYPESGYTTLLAAWLLDRHIVGAADGGPGDDLAAFVQNKAPGIISRWRGALCLSNDHCGALRGVLDNLPMALSWPTLGVAKRKRLLAQPLWPQVLLLLRALSHWGAVGSLAEAIDDQSRVLIDQGVCPTPWIDGNDLIALGYKPGPSFGRLLDGVYDEQLEGRVTSRQEAVDWLGRQGD